MRLEDYFKKGLLKKQPPHAKQIDGQLARAKKDITIAGKVIGEDSEWAATIAYHALLRAGRALLFSHGYLPAGPAQHKTVVECTGEFLGKGDLLLVKKFERMRRRRNHFFYETDPLDSVTEAETAIQTATMLLDAITSHISLPKPKT